MTALIIDTSSNTTYIALSQEGRIISSFTIESGQKLSSLLLPQIEQMLNEARLKKETTLDKTIDYLCLGIGPGSFTGTRVASTIARVFQLAWDVPIVSFSSQLLPQMEEIGALCYEKYLKDDFDHQIELVYFSSTP